MAIRIDNRTRSPLKVRFAGNGALMQILRNTPRTLDVIIEDADSDRLVQITRGKSVVYADPLNGLFTLTSD